MRRGISAPTVSGWGCAAFPLPLRLIPALHRPPLTGRRLLDFSRTPILRFADTIIQLSIDWFSEMTRNEIEEVLGGQVLAAPLHQVEMRSNNNQP